MELELPVLNMLQLVLLVSKAHELVPVALMPVVEDFFVRNWP